jgi:hypothetical protein
MMAEIIHMSNGFVAFCRDGVWGKDGMRMPCPTPAAERGCSYFLLRFASALLAHGLAIEFQAVRIVNDAVEKVLLGRARMKDAGGVSSCGEA